MIKPVQRVAGRVPYSIREGMRQRSVERTMLTPEPTTSEEAARVAAVIVGRWGEIETALSPIIGRAGLVALYRRGLHLTRRAHPWLAADEGVDHAPMDLGALKAVLARQSASNAAAGGTAFLETVCGLLRGLIGPALSDRLLSSAWGNPLDGLSTQNSSP